MIIGFAALIMIIGLLIYALSKDPKVQEIGRIMFAFGLLGVILQAPEAIKLMK
jgi:Na+/phosphate symporter